MSDDYIFSLLDNVKFSLDEKNSLYYNIKDVISLNKSDDEKSAHLVGLIEMLISSKMEEVKEKIEERKEGHFSSNSSNGAFRRVI